MYLPSTSISTLFIIIKRIKFSLSFVSAVFFNISAKSYPVYNQTDFFGLERRILLDYTYPFIVNHTTYAAFITIGVRTPSIPYRSLNAFGNTFIIICNDPFTSLLISNPELLINNPLFIRLDLS